MNTKEFCDIPHRLVALRDHANETTDGEKRTEHILRCILTDDEIIAYAKEAADAQAEVVGFLRYKLERSTPLLAEEQRADFMSRLDSFSGAAPKAGTSTAKH
jgi:hypothetical protein